MTFPNKTVRTDRVITGPDYVRKRRRPGVKEQIGSESSDGQIGSRAVRYMTATGFRIIGSSGINVWGSANAVCRAEQALMCNCKHYAITFSWKLHSHIFVTPLHLRLSFKSRRSVPPRSHFNQYLQPIVDLATVTVYP